MGQYLNPGTKGFQESLRSEIYVDKSGLIKKTNAVLDSRQKYMCVSRPRRFGKSAAMDMLAAYYSRGEDSHELFTGLEITKDASYEKHINQYNVLQINIQGFLSKLREKNKKVNMEMLLKKISKSLLTELLFAYEDIRYRDKTDLEQVMYDIYEKTKRPYVILIDEWDCILREYREDKDAQKKYLDFLRGWLKDQKYVALAYMTGILPIKKYGTHSTLNMFTEYSMIDPRELAPYFGFTEEEVKALCKEYKMGFDEARAWYDGYDLSVCTEDGNIKYSMYNPHAVVKSMTGHRFDSYWNQSETYDALKVYIQLNMGGLKDAILKMLAGESVAIDTSGFENDMVTFTCADDVMTLLVHLGYLNYNPENKTVRIPNNEVRQVYITSINHMPAWGEVARAVKASQELLQALWDKDGEAVAEGIDRAHNEISILQYNNENSLSCAINLAFYCAREYYNIYRELPTGKGFADICFVPRPLHMDKPAVVIELKWDKEAQGAIEQIKNKNYVASLQDYHGTLLLTGITYDRANKKHTSIIENYEK